MYGAVNDRTSRMAVLITVAGVALLVAAIGGFIYYKTAEDRARDEVDLPTLEAEHDRLRGTSASLRELAAAADPETKHEEFTRLKEAARQALAAYKAQARPSMLPSGRPWPWQFDRAAQELDEAFKYLQIVDTYLAQKKSITGKRPEDLADVDQNIRNVAETGRVHLLTLDEILESMADQRAGRRWTYDLPPGRRS